MGIEVATYISGLTPSWPPSADPKSQGDDHIRLIKNVLQSTFPNATKALYLPSVTALNSGVTLALTAAHDGTVVACSTDSGGSILTLPTLVIGDAGWSVEVVKYSFDTNRVTIQPASGSIYTQFGTVTLMVLGSACSAVRLVWTGAIWIARRDGPMIGSTVNFDGAGLPRGYLALDGSAFEPAIFTELYLALGTTTLRDKRGRVELGEGTGSGLTSRTNGSNYGGETHTLVPENLPPYTPSGTIGSTATVNGGGAITGVSTFPAVGGAGIPVPNGTLASLSLSGGWSFNGSAQGGVSTPVGLLQPSIAVRKIIRAC